MATARAKIDKGFLSEWGIDRPSKLPFDECIALSSLLSKLPLLGHEEPWEVIRMVPADVVPVLAAQKIDYMLVGAHGLSGWLMQARGTMDVDILLRDKDKSKASQALLARHTDLVLEKCPQVWRFSKNGEQLVDFMLTTSPLHKRVFKEFDFTTISGLKVKIPKVECALAMKCNAMTGYDRPWAKKYQDTADFVSVVRKNAKLDMKLLEELGELRYPGGGAELLKYVEDARAGRRMEI